MAFLFPVMRKIIYAENRFEPVPALLLYWDGPGFYALAKRWDYARGQEYLLVQCVERDPGRFESAKKYARELLLGEPFWANSQEEILGRYEIMF